MQASTVIFALGKGPPSLTLLTEAKASLNLCWPNRSWSRHRDHTRWIPPVGVKGEPIIGPGKVWMEELWCMLMYPPSLKHGSSTVVMEEYLLKPRVSNFGPRGPRSCKLYVSLCQNTCFKLNGSPQHLVFYAAQWCSLNLIQMCCSRTDPIPADSALEVRLWKPLT